MMSPLLTSITFPNSDEALTVPSKYIKRHKEEQKAPNAPAISLYFLCLFAALNGKLFRQLQLGLAQLESRATQIAMRVQREHDEVITTQQSHHHQRAFE